MKIDLGASKDMKPLSDAFEDAFSSCIGGCQRTCECGRTAFDAYNRWDWDEGELESLTKKATDKPDQYLICDHSISTYILCGCEFVMGCPCNAGAAVEKFILDHAQQIAKFLNHKAKDKIADARSMEVQLT